MLSMLYVRLTIKVKAGIPESFKVGWYPHKITGSSYVTLKGHKWNLQRAAFHWTTVLALMITDLFSSDSVKKVNEIEEQSSRHIQRQIPQQSQ